MLTWPGPAGHVPCPTVTVIRVLAYTDIRGNGSTFPLLTIHDLRHTAASIAIQAAANVKAVQRMLGHANAKMTLGHLRGSL
ncbi:tyrosine-type recombinase/integrase [Corynebacterium evansiae]|uniref:tyrosine-type recombinase/integrase n=1 Tax=Corynebacterium evansiae TaxID=2913499 RepID=UPI003EC00EF9